MPKIQMINMEGNPVEEIELNENIFDIDINEHAVYLVVKNILANKRQGTQSAKTRAEVRGGGRKPWRQKGTGRARQGSIRSPQWRGGGVVFAPKPRDYSYTTPKKVRRLAMKSVLTSKVQENELIVVDNIQMESAKTKNFVQMLDNIKANKKALVVIADRDLNVMRSAKNIEGVETAMASMINVYDILKYDSLIITKDALNIIEEVFN
ncbi:50S ribosomal protein L4 [Peptoniphilus stercorisuis]|uniref:Large ribosomal subunit protein uL4 n=1 Tax=Peptoniphilus stercorisuis TaxID=1436965 RepID=A0ABS4KAW7_9FIRM|nr:50S ribosomal protein L4 [Peptoniphilus stercorisuis]MBP2024908.1 large subunit ribosomal protein L4 [Peptoniphilus stercorisuis]